MRLSEKAFISWIIKGLIEGSCYLSEELTQSAAWFNQGNISWIFITWTEEGKNEPSIDPAPSSDWSRNYETDGPLGGKVETKEKARKNKASF